MGVAPPPRSVAELVTTWQCDWCPEWKACNESTGGMRRFCFEHYPIAKKMYAGALSLVEPNPLGTLSIVEEGTLSVCES